MSTVSLSFLEMAKYSAFMCVYLLNHAGRLGLQVSADVSPSVRRCWHEAGANCLADRTSMSNYTVLALCMRACMCGPLSAASFDNSEIKFSRCGEII